MHRPGRIAFSPRLRFAVNNPVLEKLAVFLERPENAWRNVP
jgi:hypothetical protein